MTLCHVIDFANAVAKSEIENSNLPRSEKELEKLRMDMMAAGIKQLVSAQQNCSHEVTVNWNWVIRVKQLAEKYGLEKVSLLPITHYNGNTQTMIAMHGGDTKSFCHEMNISFMGAEHSNNDKSEISQLEKQYGVVLYEKG